MNDNFTHTATLLSNKEYGGVRSLHADESNFSKNHLVKPF